MNILPALLLSCGIVGLTHPFVCDQKEMVKRSYGTVELRVNCKYVEGGGFIEVQEYNGKIRNGIQLQYDSLWRKRDSCFYVNGKKDGLCLYWDTLGNIDGVTPYKNGRQVGKSESYYSPGKPSNITNYNDSGETEGSMEEWWPNGNKRLVAQCKKGQIISEEEYFPNGKLRIRELNQFQPKFGVKDVRLISNETFSPKGKPTGKVVNGNGQYFLFDAEPDSTTKKYRVLHVVYKDSLEDHNEELSAKEVAKLLK